MSACVLIVFFDLPEVTWALAKATPMQLWVHLGILVLVFLMLPVVIVIYFKSFYRKVDSGSALIVNTMKAIPEVSFTGMTVIPIIHRGQVMDMTSRVLRIGLTNDSGVFCSDKVRVDVEAEFTLRVNRTPEDVLAVAFSVGVQRASDLETLRELFSAKFQHAIKMVAMRHEAQEFCLQADMIRDELIEMVGSDLNGYVLDDVNITQAKQTSLEYLDDGSILDSEGRRKIIEMTSKLKVEANYLEREALMTMKRQDVEVGQAILALEKDNQEAFRALKSGKILCQLHDFNRPLQVGDALRVVDHSGDSNIFTLAALPAGAQP